MTISSERFFDKLSDNSFDCSFFVSSSIDLFACLLVSFSVRLSIVAAVCLFVCLFICWSHVCLFVNNYSSKTRSTSPYYKRRSCPIVSLFVYQFPFQLVVQSSSSLLVC